MPSFCQILLALGLQIVLSHSHPYTDLIYVLKSPGVSKIKMYGYEKQRYKSAVSKIIAPVPSIWLPSTYAKSSITETTITTNMDPQPLLTFVIIGMGLVNVQSTLRSTSDSRNDTSTPCQFSLHFVASGDIPVL